MADCPAAQPARRPPTSHRRSAACLLPARTFSPAAPAQTATQTRGTPTAGTVAPGAVRRRTGARSGHRERQGAVPAIGALASRTPGERPTASGRHRIHPRDPVSSANAAARTPRTRPSCELASKRPRPGRRS